MIWITILLGISLFLCFGEVFNFSNFGVDINMSVFDFMFGKEMKDLPVQLPSDPKLTTSFVFWLLALIICIGLIAYYKKTISIDYKKYIGTQGFGCILVLISSILSFVSISEIGEGELVGAKAGWGIITYASVHMLVFVLLVICIFLNFREYKTYKASLKRRVTIKPANSQVGNHVNKVNTSNLNVESKSANLTLLKQYKDLYDSGVITEEEFNQKKKELL